MIYVRQGKWVLRASLVEICEIYANLHFLLAFQTTTGFANHVGCSTPLTKPAASSFLISSTMNRCHSKACFRTFCLTGRACGHTSRWCSITSLGTLEISDGCQANTSIFASRKATSALSYLSSRVALIVKVPSVPALPGPFSHEVQQPWISCCWNSLASHPQA